MKMVLRWGIIPAFLFSLLACHVPALAQTPRLCINEYLASNSKLNADPDFNEYGDWIELYNPGDVAVPLVGWYLTDNLSRPDKWRITANVSIPARGWLVIWADDRNTGLHANYKLSADGEEIGLYDYALKPVDTISFGPQTTNVSCGRYPDGAGEWRYFSTPTPGAANWNQPFEGVVSDPLFSMPGGFYSAPQTIVLSCRDGDASIHYTLDGSVPTEGSAAYLQPIVIDRTTVLRARAFRAGSLPSRVITNTCFIGESATLPVVSLSTNPENLWDDRIGIYVVGTNGVTGYCMSTPCNWNQDWERPATLEYYDEAGQQQFRLDAGIKIGGGCTRKYPQKPLAVYARSVYGSSKIYYPLFDDRGAEVYNNLVLSNGGQDWYRTFFRDGMMQNLVKGRMDIDWVAYRPALLFINGEYWGIHSLREKHNEHYLEATHGIDPDRVDILSDNASVHEGSNTLYKQLIEYVGSRDLAVREHFDYVSSQIDVDEYINYLIAEIYFANIDWPAGNIKYWRAWGEGNRWRWILFDTDLGFGAHSDGQYDDNFLAAVTSPVATSYANPPWSTLLIRKMLENEGFRDRFIQRFAGHIQTTFAPERVVHKIDSLQALIAPEIPRHKQRWPDAFNHGATWEGQVETMRTFARKRPEHMMAHIAATFALSGTAALSVRSNEPAWGRVEIEGVAMPDSLTLLYFKGIPFTCTARPAPGYRFAGWHGLSASGEKSIQLTLTDPGRLIAIFTPEAVAVEEEGGGAPAHFSLLQNYPNPFNPVTTISFDLARPELVTLKIYDLRGSEMATLLHQRLEPGRHSARFDASALANGVYFYRLEAGSFRQVRKMVLAK